VSSENLRGIILMVLSMAFFGVEDVFLKWAAERLPAGEVLVASGLAGVLIFATLAWPSGHRLWSRGALNRAVIARNAGEMVGSCFYIVALATAPLATVSAVLQTLPLAVTMASALFLGATVGWRRWSAIGVGLIGVLMVIRPGADTFQFATLGVLAAVACITLRDLATRAVPPDMPSSILSAWGMAAVAVMGVLMMRYDGRVVWPTAAEGLALVGAIVFGSAGYWTIVAASRTGEVAVVSPFRYSRLVFAIIGGILVFGEWPDGLALAGAALIILSGLYTFARERRVGANTSKAS